MSPTRAASEDKGEASLRWSDWRRLPRAFWFVVAIAGVLTLARFSEAFLVLRAQNVGLDASRAPIVMVVMAVVYAASAYPAGIAPTAAAVPVSSSPASRR